MSKRKTKDLLRPKVRVKLPPNKIQKSPKDYSRKDKKRGAWIGDHWYSGDELDILEYELGKELGYDEED